MLVRGKLVARGPQKYADYVLYKKPNLPIAVAEAKDNNHRVGDLLTDWTIGQRRGAGRCTWLTTRT